MLCVGNEFNVPEYPAYRNSKFLKHKEKFVHQLRQIRECSLKPEDKKKLITQLIDMANDELKKQLQ